MNRIHPKVNRQVRGLKDGSDRCRELLHAVKAIKETGTALLTCGASDLARTAMRASRAVGPSHSLKQVSRLILSESFK